MGKYVQKENSDKNLLALMAMLEIHTDKNMRALILESYTQQFGAIPDEYGDKIRKLLEH